MEQAAFSTEVDGGAVRFRLPDPHHHLSDVRLDTSIVLPHRVFSRVDEGWELTVEDSPVDRWEYMFAAADHSGHWQHVHDPANPRRVPGAFGEHSWLPMPTYRPPAWVGSPRAYGRFHDLPPLETHVGAIHSRVWVARGVRATDRAPLLLVHDGPEMQSLATLLDYIAAAIARGALAPMRVALIAPGERDRRYSADEGYATAVAHRLVPALLDSFPSRHAPAIMGASLGALTALHTEWRHPGTFAGLWLASGSFFTEEYDHHEHGFAYWGQIRRFVDEVAGADRAPTTARMSVVCGSAEENRGNNDLMAAHLERLGLAPERGEVRDGHYFTCWRDLFEPHLTVLLQRIWS